MAGYNTPAFKYLPKPKLKVNAMHKAFNAFVQASASMDQVAEALKKFNEGLPKVGEIIKSNPRFKFRLLIKKIKEER